MNQHKHDNEERRTANGPDDFHGIIHEKICRFMLDNHGYFPGRAHLQRFAAHAYRVTRRKRSALAG